MNYEKTIKVVTWYLNLLIYILRRPVAPCAKHDGKFKKQAPHTTARITKKLKLFFILNLK